MATPATPIVRPQGCPRCVATRPRWRRTSRLCGSLRRGLTLPQPHPHCACMDIGNLTPLQLRKAADLRENLDALQDELNQLLGGEVPLPAQPAITRAPRGPKNGRRKKRKPVGPEGRANISAAAKARWAARKGEAPSEVAPAAEPAKRKRRISRALRKTRSEAMKARWAAWRAAGRTRP